MQAGNAGATGSENKKEDKKPLKDKKKDKKPNPFKNNKPAQPDMTCKIK